jgi:type VI secretion system VasD/TssJ family lipoprotein
VLTTRLASQLLRLALLALTVAATGCGSLTARVRGIAPLNPNDYGESTPVDVRFYQLRRVERFRAASVEQLWTAPEATLANDRLGEPAIVTVFPGEAGAEPVEVGLGQRESGAEFVGVLALFRRGDARDARALALRAGDLDGAILDFAGSSVSLAWPGATTHPVVASSRSPATAKDRR